MSAEESFLSLVDLGGEKRRSPLVGMNALHKPTIGRLDLGLGSAGRKAKDLVGLLICHGARARRATRPACRITLEVFTPAGYSAVEMNFEDGSIPRT